MHGNLCVRHSVGEWEEEIGPLDPKYNGVCESTGLKWRDTNDPVIFKPFLHVSSLSQYRWLEYTILNNLFRYALVWVDAPGGLRIFDTTEKMRALFHHGEFRRDTTGTWHVFDNTDKRQLYYLADLMGIKEAPPPVHPEDELDSPEGSQYWTQNFYAALRARESKKIN
jgi:hypothetical protein